MEHPLNPLSAHIDYRHHLLQDASVVDNRVEPPPSAVNAIKYFEYIRLVGDVSLNRNGLTACRNNLVHDLLCGGGIVDVIDRHREPISRCQLCCLCTNTPGCSCDQHHLSIHGVSFLSLFAPN
jgi:hypothetical protein